MEIVENYVCLPGCCMNASIAGLLSASKMKVLKFFMRKYISCFIISSISSLQNIADKFIITELQNHFNIITADSCVYWIS